MNCISMKYYFILINFNLNSCTWPVAAILVTEFPTRDEIRVHLILITLRAGGRGLCIPISQTKQLRPREVKEFA